MMRFGFLLPLLLAACPGDESVSNFADPEAVYRLEQLGDEVLIPETTISFPEPGKIAGNGPCNSYTATQSVPYPWIRIEAIAATKRACPDLETEASYFEALQSMTLAEVSGPVLILSNDDGLEMVFRTAQD